MSIALDVARDVLDESVLHIGNTTIAAIKKDRAIYTAGLVFLRETDLVTATTEHALAQDAFTLDPTTALTGFIRDMFNRAEIDLSDVRYPIKLVPYDAIQRRTQRPGGMESGRPKLFSFLSDGEMSFDKKADVAYTIRMTHRAPMTTWTYGTGTPGAVTLNLPTEWAEQVIFTGAKYYLLRGAPGFPDAAAAGQEFFAMIEQAKGHRAPLTPAVQDRQTHPGRFPKGNQPERQATR